MFPAKGDSLTCYKYQSGTMQAVCTINLGRTVLPPSGFLSDTVMIVPNLIDTMTGIYGVSHLWADEILFENNTIAYSRAHLVYNFNCTFQYPCDYTSSPGLASGVLYQGRLFTGIPGYDGSIQAMEVFDLNYPVPPAKVFGINTSGLPFFDIQLLSNGFSLDAPALTSDSSWIKSLSHAIMIDTVKNLVFALSDSTLSIYDCSISTGISHAVSPSTHVGQVLRIGKSNDALASLIFLPHHTHPAEVSIYDMSGKRIASIGGIHGETVAWPHQNGTGVYIVRAMLDGNVITAKLYLTK